MALTSSTGGRQIHFTLSQQDSQTDFQPPENNDKTIMKCIALKNLVINIMCLNLILWKWVMKLNIHDDNMNINSRILKIYWNFNSIFLNLYTFNFFTLIRKTVGNKYEIIQQIKCCKRHKSYLNCTCKQFQNMSETFFKL